MSRELRIENILKNNFEIKELIVENESHNHSVPKNSETHFKIYCVTDDFLNVSRVDRQRKVQSLLLEELQTGLHALSLKLLTVEERKNFPPENFISPQCMGKKK